MILMLSALFCRAMENGHRIRAVSVLRVMQYIFNEIAMQSRTRVSKRLAKAIRVSHCPMSEPSISGKGEIKENQRESKVTKSENKGSKGSCKGKALEQGQVDNDDRS